MHDSESFNTSLLLKTKLYPPPVTSDLVPRTALLERLENNRHQRPLTLISAPAGFGKSILASMWLQESDCPHGWLSLDEGDSDLHMLAAYLLALIKGMFPTIFLKTETLLEVPTLPTASILARSLLNDLDQVKTPFILVLDDIHVIHEQTVFDLLTELLNHPPINMHLVLIARHDPPLPIASLRAYQRVTEVRHRDLRFTSLETSQLLQKRSGGDISDAIAVAWTEQTEGWVMALQLGALSIRHRPQTAVSSILNNEDTRYLHEYLLAEVLSQLSPTKQACLLKISLQDRFNAQLCEAVCLEDVGEDGDLYSGDAFIQYLKKANLFLINLDSKNEWFRFHHLFQSYLKDLLQKKSTPETIADLHRRASQWFAENDMIDEAVRQALAAGDTAAAVELVYEYRYKLMEKEQWNHLANLLNLFSDLVKRENLLLLTMGALNAFSLGQLSKFFVFHKQVEQLLASQSPDTIINPAVLGEIGILNIIKSITTGSSENVVKDAKKSLELLPPHAGHFRRFALGSQIIALQMDGQLKAADSIALETIKDPDCPPKLQVFLYLCLTLANFMEGELLNVMQYGTKLISLSKQNKRVFEFHQGNYFLGIAHFLRHELDEAETCLLTLIDHPEQTSSSYLAFAACALMNTYHFQARSEEAVLLLKKITTYLEEIGDTYNLEILNAFQVELALNQGQITHAHRLSHTVDFTMRPLLWFHYIPQLTPLKLLLQEGGKQNLEEAKKHLIVLDQSLLKINRKTIRIDVLATQALLFYKQNDIQSAYHKLCDSLALAKPGGFIRNYLEWGSQMAELLMLFYQEGKFKHKKFEPHVTKILTAFPATAFTQSKQTSSHSAKKLVRLTEREMEVLTFLATDLSPEEIGEQLEISTATVRTHARNIYKKLKVNGRFHAVYRAKELGLLTSF